MTALLHQDPANLQIIDVKRQDVYTSTSRPICSELFQVKISGCLLQSHSASMKSAQTLKR